MFVRQDFTGSRYVWHQRKQWKLHANLRIAFGVHGWVEGCKHVQNREPQSQSPARTGPGKNRLLRERWSHRKARWVQHSQILTMLLTVQIPSYCRLVMLF